MARFLEREYRDLEEHPPNLEQHGIEVAAGPLFVRTDQLMQAHYDQELGLFRGFLDRVYMAYTMAYYGETATVARETRKSLEQAQESKFDLICGRAGIRGDERILNLGCGFGSLERYLLPRYPEIRVVSVTPSETQVRYMMECMENPDHPFDGSRMRVIQASFDELHPEELGRFDLVISVGLIEAVHNLKAFHRKVSDFLEPGGRAFHHLIVSRVTIPQFMDSDDVLIGRYFPGGRVWPYQLVDTLAEDLQPEGRWFVNGMNYWRTLDEWHRNFWDRMEEIRASDPDVDVVHWNDYFILCKACFLPGDGRYFGNGHYLFRKPG